MNAKKNEKKERIQTIGRKICDEIAKMGYLERGYTSGSSTYVAPLTFWNTSFQILITTNPRLRKDRFNTFIKKQLSEYPELTDGYFDKRDLSCPDCLVFTHTEY